MKGAIENDVVEGLGLAVVVVKIIGLQVMKDDDVSKTTNGLSVVVEELVVVAEAAVVVGLGTCVLVVSLS